MVKRVTTGRTQEGGRLATHKQDFNAHVTGGDWRHTASNIDVGPTLGSVDLQTYLESTSFQSGIIGFVTIGDGYSNTNLDLADAFDVAFANSRLSNGGIIVVKAGRYKLRRTIGIFDSGSSRYLIPNGITIFGENSGAILICETDNAPIVDVQETTAEEEKFTMINMVIYDNLDGAHPSFGVNPSFQTEPAIRCHRGSNVLIQNCAFIGRANNVSNITHRFAGFDDGTTSSEGSKLEIYNTHISNVKSSAEFDGQLGADDVFVMDHCILETLGDGGSGTIENRYGLSYTNCNVQITNIRHTGTFTTWNADGFAHVKTDPVSDTDTEMQLTGNSGGIPDHPGIPVYLNNEPSASTVMKSGTWESGIFTVETPNLTVDNDGYIVTTAGITTKELTVTNRDIVAGTTYVLQDADFGTTLQFSTSRTVIDCRTITTYGIIGLELNWTPTDGEEITVSIVNHETRTPSIVKIEFDDAMFFKNNIVSITDEQCPDPRPGGITNYRFIYNGIAQSFDLISKTVSLWSTTSNISFDYNRDELKGLGPQKSLSAFPFLTATSGSTYDNVNSTGVFPSRCVYSRNKGILMAAGAFDTLAYTENGTDWGEIQLDEGFLGGGASRIALVEENTSTTFVIGAGQIANAVRRVSINHYSAGPPFQSGSSISVSLSGTFTVNCILWHGPGSNRVLVGTQDGISVLNSPFTSESTKLIIGNNIVDMSRAPDGRIMAISSGSNKVWMYTPATAGDFATAPTFTNVAATGLSGNPQKVSYNRVLDRWYVITDATTDFYYSANNGATFSATSSPPVIATGSLSDFRMIGNTNVICYVTGGSGFGGLFYWSEANLNWKSISVANPEAAGFVTVSWVGGKLIAIRQNRGGAVTENPLAVCATIDCGNYGHLDFDK